MRRLLALATASILLFPVTTQALPITYTFSGVFVSVAPEFSGVLSVGDGWSFSASTDTTSLPRFGFASATYPASGAWTLDRFAGTFTGGFVLVADDRFGSDFGAGVIPAGFPVTSFILPSLIEGAFIQGMIVELFGASGLFSPTLALPASVNFDDFPFGFPSRLTLYGNSFVTYGVVTSATVTTTPVPVAEPTSALLVCTGLVTLCARRFRR